MSHREIKVTLQPLAEFPVSVVGEFFYIKQAVRDFKVIIHDQTHTVKEGDHARYDRKPFESLALKNPDSVRPLAVIMVVGFGSYDQKIMQGNVTVQPGVRKADGSFVDDRRFWLPLTAAFNPVFKSKLYQAGDTQVTELLPNAGVKSVTSGDDYLYVLMNESGADYTEGNYLFHKFNVAGEMIGIRTLNIPTSGGSGILSYKDNGLAITEGFPVVAYAGDKKDVIYQESGNTSVNDSYYKELASVGAGRKIGGAYVDRESGTIYAISSNGTDRVQIHNVDYDGNVSLVGEFDYANVINFGSPKQCKLFKRGDSFIFFALNKVYVFSADGDSVYSTSAVEASSFTYYGALVGDFLYLASKSNALLDTFLVTHTDFTETAKGFFQYGKGGKDVRVLKTQRAESTTKAAIDITGKDSGLHVKGQVIKMALELYSGKEVGPNYMDHVYGVRINSGDNSAGVLPYQEISSRGETMLAANIGDSFEAFFGGTIEIQIDDSLKYI
tara:strand:+ start:7330 stop:8823 length:1494 start_codon:yes stop_codon:yes gene_type:complete